MFSSVRLQLPLVQAAQAQKHVTVNEAFVRLDGMTNLTLQSATVAVAPSNPVEGEVFAVPSGATGVWAGQDGLIAVASNGGWVFVAPSRGWRAWIADEDRTAIFDGSQWRSGAVSLTANSAQTIFETYELLHTVIAANSNTLAGAIPAGSMVIGVTGRVTSAVTGSLSSWRIGVAGSENRYGSGLGIGQSSWLEGMTSSPVTYFADTDLILTAEGGDFAGGEIRLAVHAIRLAAPIG